MQRRHVGSQNRAGRCRRFAARNTLADFGYQHAAASRLGQRRRRVLRAGRVVSRPPANRCANILPTISGRPVEKTGRPRRHSPYLTAMLPLALCPPGAAVAADAAADTAATEAQVDALVADLCGPAPDEAAQVRGIAPGVGTA